MKNQWNRRRFLSTASRAAAGLVILRDSRSVWGCHANDKLNVAIVGAGGMGAWNLAHVAGENVEFGSGMRVKPASQPEMTGENIVALCDVDERSAAARLAGETYDPERHGSKAGIKAVTYHELAVEQSGDRWKAHVVFDV